MRYLFPVLLLLLSQTSLADVRKVFLTAGQVFSTISPEIENEFDVYIIANTAETGSESDLIPFQHARFLLKKDPAAKIFKRNSQGQVTGIREANATTLDGLPKLLPISSGKEAHKSILSFSGVFRVNHKKSKNSLSTSKEAAMSYGIYLDAYYPSEGRESGAAIHGTPTKNHDLLGNSRASHGCLRTYPAYAKLMYTYVIQNETMYSDDLLDLDRTANLPSPEAQAGLLEPRKGTRALFIIFNGY